MAALNARSFFSSHRRFNLFAAQIDQCGPHSLFMAVSRYGDRVCAAGEIRNEITNTINIANGLFEKDAQIAGRMIDEVDVFLPEINLIVSSQPKIKSFWHGYRIR